MTVDKYGEGLSVSWMISNSEDTSLIMFIRAMNDRCGNIVPCQFMSDDEEQNLKDQHGVFGGRDTHKVICVW